MIKSVIWLDDKKNLKSVQVTMSTNLDWNFARNFQDFLVDKVTEFNHLEGEQGENKSTH
jgi:hypothetical protein